MRCTSVNRCAAVYAGGLHLVAWRVVGHNHLAAMVEVPQIFFNRTVGLMGLWSSNRSDDFLMSDGRLLLSADLNPPSEETLHPFGLSCEWTLVRQFAGQVQEFSPWAFFSFKILNKNVHCYYYKNVGFIGNDSRPTTFGLFPFHEELTTSVEKQISNK